MVGRSINALSPRKNDPHPGKNIPIIARGGKQRKTQHYLLRIRRRPIIPISTVSNNRNHCRYGRFIRMPAILFWKTNSNMKRMVQTDQGRSVILLAKRFPNRFSSSTLPFSLFLPGFYSHLPFFDLTPPLQYQPLWVRKSIIHSQLTLRGAQDVAVAPEIFDDGRGFDSYDFSWLNRLGGANRWS